MIVANEVKPDSTTKKAWASKKLGICGSVATACIASAALGVDKAEYVFASWCLAAAAFTAVGYALAQALVEAAAAWRKAA